MIEQYKKEMSEIHAPENLIKRLREAMNEEERSKNRRAKRAVPALVAVAAVILVLILIPGVLTSEEHSFRRLCSWGRD